MNVANIPDGAILKLAERLGLRLSKIEGNDIKGHCPFCESSSFGIDQHDGKYNCFRPECGGGGVYDLTLRMLKGDKEKVEDLLVECKIFETKTRKRRKPKLEIDPADFEFDGSGVTLDGDAKNATVALLHSPAGPIDFTLSDTYRFHAIDKVAELKHVTRESMLLYGAVHCGFGAVDFPVYDDDLKKCGTFRISWQEGGNQKGYFTEGSEHGLFCPHVDGNPRRPQPGDEICFSEGFKDPCALHALGCLAYGMPTCYLDEKFGVLFTGCDCILVHDLDVPAVDGTRVTVYTLQGHAASTKIARLPGEIKNSKGDDVRDILQLSDGESLVRQAIADAAIPAEGWAKAKPKKPKPESSLVGGYMGADMLDPASEANVFLHTQQVDGVAGLRFWHGSFWKWLNGSYYMRPIGDVRADVINGINPRYRRCSRVRSSTT